MQILDSLAGSYNEICRHLNGARAVNVLQNFRKLSPYLAVRVSLNCRYFSGV